MGAMDDWTDIDPQGLYWEREHVHWPGRLSRWCSRVNVHHYAKGIEELARDRGWLLQGVGIREIDGCVYFGVIPIGGRNIPAPPTWLAKILMPVVLRVVPEFRRRVANLDRDYDTGYWPKVIDDWLNGREDELLAEAHRLLTINLDALSDSGLAALATESMNHAGQCMKEHFHLHGAGIHAISILGRELTSDHGFTTAEFAGLLTGLSDTTTGPAAGQQRIVDEVIAASAEKTLEAAQDLTTVRSISRAVDSAVQDYLDSWGRRAIRYQVAYPTVGERPDWVLATLKTQLAHGIDAAARQERHAELRRSTEQRVLRALGDTAATRSRIALAQKAAPIREGNETATVALPSAALRFVGLEMGRRLVGRGQLDGVEHVFDLELEEAAALLIGGPDDAGVPAGAKALAAKRHAHRHSDAKEPPRAIGKKVDPPDVAAFPPRVAETMGALLWLVEKGGAGAEASNDGDAVAAKRTAATKSDAAIRLDGTGASPGVYEGRVCVVNGEADFDKLEDGDVMVCPITSPIWAMLFPVIGALVCDVGGPMSHPAIISREFGIPSVLNVGDGTTALLDGQQVRVDGSSGIVTVIDGATPA